MKLGDLEALLARAQSIIRDGKLNEKLAPLAQMHLHLREYGWEPERSIAEGEWTWTHPSRPKEKIYTGTAVYGDKWVHLRNVNGFLHSYGSHRAEELRDHLHALHNELPEEMAGASDNALGDSGKVKQPVKPKKPKQAKPEVGGGSGDHSGMGAGLRQETSETPSADERWDMVRHLVRKQVQAAGWTPSEDAKFEFGQRNSEVYLHPSGRRALHLGHLGGWELWHKEVDYPNQPWEGWRRVEYGVHYRGVGRHLRTEDAEKIRKALPKALVHRVLRDRG